MVTASDLTPGQCKALISAVYGIEKLAHGFCEADDPNVKVDGRSLAALHRKELILWYSSGAAPQVIHVEATQEGHRIFEEELRW